MRTMKIFMFFSIILTVMAALFLFRMKNEVLSLEKTIMAVSSDIGTVQEELAVLSNEMFILTTPKRMEGLSQSHLKEYQRLNKNQLISPTPRGH